ncbi:MAG: hypothetical protein K0R65_2070 [Crocinitomicaceae bacterium]|jgi:hypothetical protein|nr:hypothetical protein [Crocinitomicaceae bacterium]
MKEDYLHAIWRLKRIPYHNLYLTDGRKLTIRKTGWHNHDAGPDFFNGSVEIDGIRWNGNIEIHIKSSDWYVHRHHLDPAYDSVILHVVFEHDREVLIKGQAVPTLELRFLLDMLHWEKYSSLLSNPSWIPCEKSLPQVASSTIANQLESLVIDRLERKTAIYKEAFCQLGEDPLRLYYEMYALAFGLKVNALPFVELTRKLDLRLLWKEDPQLAPVILYGVAGFFQYSERFGITGLENEWRYLQRKYGLDEMDFHSWRFKGLRPVSFPNRKLLEFAALCSRQDFFRIHELDYPELLRLFETLEVSESFRNHLLINVAAPVLWWNYARFDNIKSREKALEILLQTSPESNAVVKRWKKLGVKCKSSFETQGLLELKNELCERKKCLQCKIAYEILKQ